MVSELAVWWLAVFLSVAAVILSLVYLPAVEPLPDVVTTVVLPENVPCLPPFRLLANFRYVHTATANVNYTQYGLIGERRIWTI